MPIFREHTNNCINHNISKEICEIVNKEMDEPSKWIPGCRHREFRHQIDDCSSLAQSFGEEAYSACILHIKDDCREGKEICKQSLPCRDVENLLI
jgi:hypothetical protein